MRRRRRGKRRGKGEIETEKEAEIGEGFECLGEQLNLAEGMNDLQEPKGDGEWNIG